MSYHIANNNKNILYEKMAEALKSGDLTPCVPKGSFLVRNQGMEKALLPARCLSFDHEFGSDHLSEIMVYNLNRTDCVPLEILSYGGHEEDSLKTLIEITGVEIEQI